jgi:proteasome lid subunit RPN8/RPN11
MRAAESDFQLHPELLRQMEMHALSAGDAEVCGLVFQDRYVRIDNVSDDPLRFLADPAQLAQALSLYGEPDAVFHSHPDGNLLLSAEDSSRHYYVYSYIIVGCVRSDRLQWKIRGGGRLCPPACLSTGLMAGTEARLSGLGR